MEDKKDFQSLLDSMESDPGISTLNPIDRIDPKYFQYSMEELEQALADIDEVKFPARAGRIRKAMEDYDAEAYVELQRQLNQQSNIRSPFWWLYIVIGFFFLGLGVVFVVNDPLYGVYMVKSADTISMGVEIILILFGLGYFLYGLFQSPLMK